jgi:hypothetical protein
MPPRTQIARLLVAAGVITALSSCAADPQDRSSGLARGQTAGAATLAAKIDADIPYWRTRGVGIAMVESRAGRTVVTVSPADAARAKELMPSHYDGADLVIETPIVGDMVYRGTIPQGPAPSDPTVPKSLLP